MPRKPPRPCPVHGCPTLLYDGDECPLHPRQRDRTREAVRASASRRGYGPKWKAKRDRYVKSHPWCVDPYGMHQGQRVRMKIVDHIIPLKQGGRDDETNYQSLCMQCHNYKTAHDGSRKYKGGAV